MFKLLGVSLVYDLSCSRMQLKCNQGLIVIELILCRLIKISECGRLILFRYKRDSIYNRETTRGIKLSQLAEMVNIRKELII